MRIRCKYILFFFCIVTFSILMSGCESKKKETTEKVQEVTPMEPEEVYAVSFDIIGGNDVMPIAGFYGPYDSARSINGNKFPNFIADEYYKLLSEAGVNIISHANTSATDEPALMKSSLELAEKYNMGIFVTDWEVINQVLSEEVDVADVTEHISRYYDYKSFCGMYLVDEPTSIDYYWHPELPLKNLSAYAKLSTLIQKDLNIPCYVNLYACMTPEDFDAYRKYVEECCRDINQKMLMYDFYMWDIYSEDRMQHYFKNLGVIREYAEKYKIPFWSYIQAGGQWNDGGEPVASIEYYPNEYQFNFNVNVCLASGAKGIQYFPLIEPVNNAVAENNGWDFHRNGLLGAMGNKTQWYYYAQKINKHIGVIDEVLMNSAHKGIVVSGESATKETALANYVIKSGKFQELQSVTGDALVGCFNYNGKTALYVTNYSHEYAQKITLDFNKTHDINVVQNAEKSYVNAQSITLDMAAGEGVLLVIE